MSEVDGIKLRGLKKRHAALLDQFSAEWDQLDLTTGADYARREGVCKALEVELRVLEQSIASLEGPSRFATQVPLDLRHKFPQIDFTHAHDTFGELLARYPEGGLHTVLAVEEGYRMGGEWCVTRIVRRLKDAAPNAQSFAYQISAGATPTRLLGEITRSHVHPDRLPEYLGYGDDPTGIVSEIVGAFWHSSVAFFEFRVLEPPDLHRGTIDWVLNRFWRVLGDTIEERREALPNAKTIALLHFDDPLPESLRSGATASPGSQYPLLLPIELCDEAAIRSWLSHHIRHPKVDTDSISKLARGAHGAAQQGGYRRMFDYLSNHLVDSGATQ